MSLVLEKKFKGEAKFLHFVFMVSRQWITEKGKEARNILQLHQHHWFRQNRVSATVGSAEPI